MKTFEECDEREREALRRRFPTLAPMGTIFEEREGRHPNFRWPQWGDIQRPLEALGLASQGSRLIAEGFQAQFIEIPSFGVAELRAFPKSEVPKGRASPHRLQVKCTCGQWVFFGKLNQHYPSLNHARMAAHRQTCEAVHSSRRG
jgi:hypothetical protein